jgi:hypothetical protein
MCPTRSLHANLLNRCVLQSATSITLEKCNPAVNIPADQDLSGLADEHAYGISHVILFMVGTLLLASVLLVSRQMKHPTLAGHYCQCYWMPTFLQEAADCFFGVFSHTKNVSLLGDSGVQMPARTPTSCRQLRTNTSVSNKRSQTLTNGGKSTQEEHGQTVLTVLLNALVRWMKVRSPQHGHHCLAG